MLFAEFLVASMAFNEIKSLIETNKGPILEEDNSGLSEEIKNPIGCHEWTLENPNLNSAVIAKETTLEKWIEEETRKKCCPWQVCKMEDTEWTFYVFYNMAKLKLRLNPVLDTVLSDSKSRSVHGIELISLLDVRNRDCDNLAVSLFLERCSPIILKSFCQTTDQLPQLFAFICREIKSLDALHKQMIKLSKYYPVIFKDNGFIFSFGSQILMKLFYVKVNLTNWKNGSIPVDDVKVINKIGNMREKDIQDILKCVKTDDNYLPNFYDEVKSFLKILEDLED